jgi:hypothetical protein
MYHSLFSGLDSAARQEAFVKAEENLERMHRKPGAMVNLHVRAHALWNAQWRLLTAGDFAAGRFNTMTASWGEIVAAKGTEGCSP